MCIKYYFICCMDTARHIGNTLFRLFLTISTMNAVTRAEKRTHRKPNEKSSTNNDNGDGGITPTSLKHFLQQRIREKNPLFLSTVPYKTIFLLNTLSRFPYVYMKIATLSFSFLPYKIAFFSMSFFYF